MFVERNQNDDRYVLGAGLVGSPPRTSPLTNRSRLKKTVESGTCLGTTPAASAQPGCRSLAGVPLVWLRMGLLRLDSREVHDV